MLHLAHLGGEHAPPDVEQLADQWITEAVVDGAIATRALDDALSAQDAELLRRRGWLDLELTEQVPDAHLSVPQQLEHPQTQRMAKRLEEPSLEVMERLATASGGTCAHADAVFMNS